MMKNRFLSLACLALACFAVKATAQDDVDCTRYRGAGLPCPAKPVAGGTRAPEPVRPPIRAGALTKPAAPAASAARAAAVAPLAAPSPVRVLSVVVPVASPTAVMRAPLLAASSSGRLAPLPGFSAPAITLAPGFAPLVTDNREPGQVVVYWPSIDEAEAALVTLARDRRVQSVSSAKLDHLGGLVATFQLKTQAEASEFRSQLIRDFPGLAVDFNTRYRPLQQKTQPRIYLPQKIDLPPTPGISSTAKNLRIGIIDGPVLTIAALAGSHIIRKSFLAATDTLASADHATAIAALIAGQDRAAGFVGVAPQATLYSAEIMRSVGQSDVASSNALIRALDWLLSEKVHVINLSLGGPGDAVMAKAFARLAELPVIAVAAVGNGGPDAKPAYPAAYPGVIAVTATDALDVVYGLANQGAYITLAAPGVDLWVPDAGAGHYVSGTSFAAAVVTAASALLLALRPQHSAQTLLRQFCRSAKDLGDKGFDTVFGCGLIQISAALRDDRF